MTHAAELPAHGRSTRDPRPRRLAPAMAVGMLAICLAMIAFSLASVVLPSPQALPNRPTLLNFLAVLSVFVTFPTVGAILAILRPANPMGWLFLTIGGSFAIGIFSTEYVGRSLYGGLQLPAVTLVAWLGSWGYVLGIGLAVTLVPLLFPDGRLRDRIQKLLAACSIVLIAVAAVSQALLSPSPDDPMAIVNPLAMTGQAADLVLAVNTATLPAIAAMGLICMTSLAFRFRASGGVEREQLKWLLLAGVAFAVALGGAVVTMADPWFYAMMVGAALIPIAVGIAVLRHRLYEIDRFVSRTIGWAIVTGTLVVIFVAAVVGLQTVLAPWTENNTLAVAASTLVAAALFQPLRGRIQRGVDRRFNRSRVDADRAVSAFSAHARDEVDLGQLGRIVVETAHRAVAPATAEIWLRAG